MRSFTATLCAVFGIVAFASLCPAWAQPSEAISRSTVAPSPGKATTLQITHQNGIVTVRDGDNKALFAQVIATPNLRIAFDATRFFKSVTLVLRDGNNKKIWEHKIGNGGAANFAMNFGQKNGSPATITADGLFLTLTPTETDETIETPNHIKGDMLLGNDNLLIHAEFAGKGEGMRFERVGDALQMYRIEKGAKTLTGTLNIDKDNRFVSAWINDKALKGVANGTADIYDGVGAVKVGSLIKDGKTYIDLDLGNRHIYIEGTLGEIKSDGSNITIDTKTKDTKQN